VLVAFLGLVAASGCRMTSGHPPERDGTAALGDSLKTIFDSLAAIHRDHPDTGLLRRLHPAADSIHFVEGSTIEWFTGDSLFRRVQALHVPVTRMRQHFDQRAVQVLDQNHAVLTARESVEWSDGTGSHGYAGLLTLVTVRRNGRWVIASYRGT
jgi:hypothetical protein